MTKRPLTVDQLEADAIGPQEPYTGPSPAPGKDVTLSLQETEGAPPPVPEKDVILPLHGIKSAPPPVPEKDVILPLRDTETAPLSVSQREAAPALHETGTRQKLLPEHYFTAPLDGVNTANSPVIEKDPVIQLPINQHTTEATRRDCIPSSGRVPEKDSCPSLPLGLIAVETHLDFAFNADAEEKDQLRQKILVLEHQVRDLKNENESLLRDQEALEDEFCDLRERYNTMTINNRNARATSHAASEEVVVKGFMDLCLHIAAWCDEASFKAGGCQVDAAATEELGRFLQLQQDLNEGALQANSNLIGRALLFRVLVESVFYSSFSDLENVKDLWASAEDADRLHSLEHRLMASGLMPCDLRLWLAITARGFKSSGDSITKRISYVVDGAWNRVVGLYGLAESASAAKMRLSLESNVIARAVELSYMIRTCRSSVWIRFPENLVPSNTEEVIRDPHQLRSRRESATCSETVVCFELVSRPALFMDSSRFSGRSNEEILYTCEKNIIYSERTQGV